VTLTPGRVGSDWPAQETHAVGLDELKERIQRAKARIPAPTCPQAQWTRIWWFAGGIGMALAIFLSKGGVRLAPRPPSLLAFTSLGTCGLLAAGIWLSFTRGGSVLGRPGWLLGPVIALSPVLLVAWRYGISVQFGQVQRWPARPGLRCLGMGVVTGVPLLQAALLAWRHGRPLAPATAGASFGAGSGLASAVLVDLWCPASYLPHLLLGHLLPIGVLAALGALLGRHLLGFQSSWTPATARRKPNAPMSGEYDHHPPEP
jgi:hypothetical protein